MVGRTLKSRIEKNIPGTHADLDILENTIGLRRNVLGHRKYKSKEASNEEKTKKKRKTPQTMNKLYYYTLENY